jgi:hypothetical protein
MPDQFIIRSGDASAITFGLYRNLKAVSTAMALKKSKLFSTDRWCLLQ